MMVAAGAMPPVAEKTSGVKEPISISRTRCSYARLLSIASNTVNCRSVEKLRTLHIAWLHRKVMVEDFRTQYAFFNGPAIDCKLFFFFFFSITQIL